MPPAHGNFNRAQAMAPRQIQQLRIEPETLNGLLFEDDAAALAPEGLETTLGIDERQPQNAAHNLVENDSGEFAERRLVHGDQAAAHSPRANGHVIGSRAMDRSLIKIGTAHV